jgi:hypothetical protein
MEKQFQKEPNEHRISNNDQSENKRKRTFNKDVLTLLPKDIMRLE